MGGQPYTFSAGRIHRPASIAEVRRLVARSPRIHAIGARHSFNGVADSPGELLDLRDIDPDFLAGAGVVSWVGRALRYSDIACRIDEDGEVIVGDSARFDPDAAHGDGVGRASSR